MGTTSLVLRDVILQRRDHQRRHVGAALRGHDLKLVVEVTGDEAVQLGVRCVRKLAGVTTLSSNDATITRAVLS